MKKILVLENDDVLEASLFRYVTESLKAEFLTIVYGASGIESNRIMQYFEQNEVLVFQPTIINHIQFMLMMMAMWNLLQENKLGIKEIQVYRSDEKIEDEIKEVFQNKKLHYLKDLLSVVRVVQIDKFENEERELKLY